MNNQSTHTIKDNDGHLAKANCFPKAYIIFIISCMACSDFLDVGNPKTELAAGDVYQSDGTAISTMNVIYTNSLGTGGLSGFIYHGALLADESFLHSTDVNMQQFFTNNLTPSNSTLIEFWGNSGYTNIYYANAVLEGLDNSTAITPTVKTQLQGEALFMRAFYHFYLVNFFGDIPYVTSTNYRANTTVKKMSTSEVYTHIITDLLLAQMNLSPDYSFSNSERIKPNKSAATAMLARAYLYTRQYDLAEQQASALTSNSMFSLSPLNESFLKNSSEAIWQLKPVSTRRNTTEGSIFILTGKPRFSSLRAEFINSFEGGDLRKTNWTNSITVDTDTYYYPFKYKIRTGNDPLDEYSIVLRLAEQYLIRAEARCQQNKLVEAIADVDAIRERAGLPLIKNTNPAISKEDLLRVIERERRSELFSEWAHRWFDLKRTGRAMELLAPLKTGWQPTDALLPIPATEVIINSNMKQNVGY